jgi:hypothetical protein
MTTLNINQTIAAGQTWEQSFTTSTPAGEGNLLTIDLTYTGDASVAIIDANGGMELLPGSLSGGRVQHSYMSGGYDSCNYTLRIQTVSGTTIAGTITYA